MKNCAFGLYDNKFETISAAKKYAAEKYFQKVVRYMISMNRHTKKRLLLSFGISLALTLLLTGPLVINYMFLKETTGWNIDLAFSAGEMLQYYGAVLGGLITCFAIITTIYVNNKNRRNDWKRQQFEHTYALYHKLPEILAKLELTAIHVQYSVHLHEDKLLETLDAMKESESILREHQFTNNTYYSKDIELLLKRIIAASVRSQESVENYLQDKKNAEKDLDPAHKMMEDSFFELRKSINSAKSEIMMEINQFVSVYSSKG